MLVLEVAMVRSEQYLAKHRIHYLNTSLHLLCSFFPSTWSHNIRSTVMSPTPPPSTILSYPLTTHPLRQPPYTHIQPSTTIHLCRTGELEPGCLLASWRQKRRSGSMLAVRGLSLISACWQAVAARTPSPPFRPHWTPPSQPHVAINHPCPPLTSHAAS